MIRPTTGRRWLLVALSVLLILSPVVVGGCGKADQQPITSKNSKFEVATGDSTDTSPGKAAKGQPASNEAPIEPSNDPPSNLSKPPSRPPAVVQNRTAEARAPAKKGRGADEADDAGQGLSKPSPPRVRPDKIPDGTPDELVALLGQVEKEGPRGRTNRELMDSLRQWLSVRLALCDKILAADDATEEHFLRAGKAKREVLVQMIQAGFPDIDKQMQAFSKEMRASKSEGLVRLGKLTELHMSLAMVVSMVSTGAEPKLDDFAAAMQSAMELEPADEELFESLVSAAATLQQAGMMEEALPYYKSIQTKYADVDSERIKRDLSQLAEMSSLIEIKFDTLTKAAATSEPESGPALLDATAKLLVGQPGPLMLERLSQVAYQMEVTRHYDIATKIYEALAAAYKDHPNAEIAEHAAQEVASGQKRANLVGQTFDLDAKRLDGKEFNWKAYEGKIVLVDFWATWCAPCQAELPNIKRNYEKYRKQGFEVVGVNLDQDRGDVDQYFAVQSLPWTTVVDADELAKKCGVESIPFVVLVGRDGKVIDLHVRGEQLGKRLAEIFAEGDKTDADAPASGAPEDSKSSTNKTSYVPLPAARFGGGFVAADEPAAPATPPTRAASGTSRKASAGASVAKEPAAPNNAPAPDAKPDAAEPNPYLAKAGLKAAQLADYLLNMQEKPKSIQSRTGFAAAVIDAADRLLAADTTDKFRGIATLAKLETLHKQASTGDQQADQLLQQFVDSIKDKPLPAANDSIRFLLLERQVVQSKELPVDKIPDLLAQVKQYCTDEKLEARHLRLASSTVEVINRLEDGDAREKHFAEFGKLFGKSSDKELARYGKKLAKAPPGKESDLVGKPLELEGSTAAGGPFDWKAYRGKVVIVDFWATWCGPCIREMPNVRAAHEKYKDQGFDIVGVSLDQDQEALADFLEKNPIPWTTLAGDGTQELAQKYGVRGIPTVMLIDREGKIVAVTHQIGQLIPELEKLLAAK